MDAETRHSLKQNELAQAISKLRDFNLDSGTRRLLLIVLAVVLALAAWRVWRWSAESAREGGWAELQSAVGNAAANIDVSLERLRTLSGSSSGALKLTAQFYEAVLLCDKANKDAANFVELLTRAAGELKAIVESSEATGFHVSAAAFRLASVYESLRNFGEARKMYQLLIDDPRCAAQGFRELARERLATLDSLVTPVTLTPGDPPPPPELSGPPEPPIPMIDVSQPRPTQPTEAPPAGSPPGAPSGSSEPSPPTGEPVTPPTGAEPASDLPPSGEPPASQPGGPGLP